MTRILVLSLLGAVGVTALLVGLSSAGLSRVGLLLTPGMYGAAVLFPEGIHSDAPYAYLALAAVVQIVTTATLIAGVWALIKKNSSS